MRRPFPAVINCRWKKCLKRMHYCEWQKEGTDMKMSIRNDLFLTPDFIQFSQLKYIILLLFFRFFRSIICVIFQAFWFTLMQLTHENIYNSYNALSLWFISISVSHSIVHCCTCLSVGMMSRLGTGRGTKTQNFPDSNFVCAKKCARGLILLAFHRNPIFMKVCQKNH